jgi:hypothetical protein
VELAADGRDLGFQWKMQLIGDRACCRLPHTRVPLPRRRPPRIAGPNAGHRGHAHRNARNNAELARLPELPCGAASAESHKPMCSPQCCTPTRPPYTICSLPLGVDCGSESSRRRHGAARQTRERNERDEAELGSRGPGRGFFRKFSIGALWKKRQHIDFLLLYVEIKITQRI